jgi:hypothetical protein
MTAIGLAPGCICKLGGRTTAVPDLGGAAAPVRGNYGHGRRRTNCGLPLVEGQRLFSL